MSRIFLFLFVLLNLFSTPPLRAAVLCQSMHTKAVNGDRFSQSQGECGFCWLYATSEALNSIVGTQHEDISVDYPIAAEVVQQINALVALENPDQFHFESPFRLDGVHLLDRHGSVPNRFWNHKSLSKEKLKKLAWYIDAYQYAYAESGEKLRFLNAVISLLADEIPMELERTRKNQVRLKLSAKDGLENIEPHEYAKRVSRIISTDYLVAQHLIESSLAVLDDSHRQTELVEGGWYRKAKNLLARRGILPYWAYHLKKELTAADFDKIRKGVKAIADEYHLKKQGSRGGSMHLIGVYIQKIVDFLVKDYINAIPEFFEIDGKKKTPSEWYQEVMGSTISIALESPPVGSLLDVPAFKPTLSDIQNAWEKLHHPISLKVGSEAFPELIRMMVDSNQSVYVAVGGWAVGKTVNEDSGRVDIFPSANYFENYHAVTITGYLTENGLPDGEIIGFRYQNSHSREFGEYGSGVMSMNYFRWAARTISLWLPHP